MADKELHEQDDQSVAVEEKVEGPETPEKFQAKLKESIQIDVESVGTLRKKLKVTIPQDVIIEQRDSQFKELISDAIVPGFRRGRAPRRLVEKRFGREVNEQIQTKLISNAYLAAIDKEELKVLGDPLVWAPLKDAKRGAEGAEELVDMPNALDRLKLPSEGDFSFSCEVELKPAFDLPALEGIDVEKPDVKITDEDVGKEIDRMLAVRGSFAPVLDGSIQADDLLVCDVRVTVDGQEVTSHENISVAVRPQRIEGITLADFGEKMAGAATGDSRSFEGTIPEDHERSDLRGKQATLEFKVNDIKRLQLPPLDSEYLSSIGFESQDEFRGWVRTRMESQLDSELRRGMRRQISEHLVKNVAIELPEGLSNRQTDRVVQRRMVELARNGVPEAEINKHVDELRTEAQEQAIQDLKLHFILERIAEEKEIDVTEEEINTQIASIARAYGRRFDRVRDELARSGGLESLFLEIRDEKSLEALLAQAKVTEATLESIKEKAAAKRSSKAEAPKVAAADSKDAKAEAAGGASEDEDEPASAKGKTKSGGRAKVTESGPKRETSTKGESEKAGAKPKPASRKESASGEAKKKNEGARKPPKK